MPRRRSARDRSRRAQRILAVVLLICMALGGTAIYAISATQAPAPQSTPTQQGR